MKYTVVSDNSVAKMITSDLERTLKEYGECIKRGVAALRFRFLLDGNVANWDMDVLAKIGFNINLPVHMPNYDPWDIQDGDVTVFFDFNTYLWKTKCGSFSFDFNPMNGMPVYPTGGTYAGVEVS